MNAMTKAHQIRKAAAVKFNCKASEIHFGECLRMAHNGEEITVEEVVINVVPENYPGDPKAAMGYCWSNYETKEPGKDIEKEGWESAALEIIKKTNAKKAWVNCMWVGGYTGEYPKAAKKTAKKIEEKEEAPEMAGWCGKCQSYCFGDCEA